MRSESVGPSAEQGHSVLSGSFKIGTLLGIPLYVHWTFWVMVAWFMFGPLVSGNTESLASALRTGGFVLAIFGCVVLHEMGHALAARRYGIATHNITLLPIGGIASLERIPEKPVQELVVALAGPAVNVVIAGLIIPAVLLTEGTGAFGFSPASGAPDGVATLHRAHFLASLGLVNLTLVVFNMIPALPMDGGRVLRALLAMGTNRTRATTIAAAIGQVIAVGFAIVGVFAGNLLLLIIATFVFLSARSEAQAEQVRSVLIGLPASAAMLTRFQSLRASHSVSHAVNELLAGSQQDFPVLADDASGDDDAAALIGILTRTDLVRAVVSGNADQTVSSVMRPGCDTVNEGDDLQIALEHVQATTTHKHALGGCPVIAVVRPAASAGAADYRRIIGIITPDNLSELVLLRGRTARPRAGADR